METGIETIQIHFSIDGWTLSQGILHNYSMSCTMLNKHCVRRLHDYFAILRASHKTIEKLS